jgi:hypothetical protein
MTTVKIVKLTYFNVKALDECREAMPSLLATTASTAEFADVKDAVRQVQALIHSLKGRGHPKASLHAVLRKLVALVPPASPEMLAQLGAHDPACPGPVMAPVFGLPGPRECMACGWTS